jgi:hypothetical protein
MKEYLIESVATKKMLAKAGLIKFPVDTNSKGKPFAYVDNGKDDNDSFEHKGKKYRLKYHSGCFYPFLYQVN